MGQDLESIFATLGLSQYVDTFIDQGFDSWETILDIQESDLDALGVKLGHRRKLQRRIANARGVSQGTLLVSPIKSTHDEAEGASTNDAQHTERSHESDLANAVSNGNTNGTNANPNGVTKRKYRRHPKPDENAPERPPSAYVLFSNKMREDLKGHNLTFTEIAKLVGENWQSLASGEKEAYERQANIAKDKYHRELAEYKKTPENRRYAQYLHEFKEKQAKQNQANEAAKRLKVDAPARLRHGSTSSSSTPSQVLSSGRESGSGSGSEPPPTRRERVNSGSSLPDSSAAHMLYHKSLDESRTALPSNYAGRDMPLPDRAKLAEAGQRSLPPLSDMLPAASAPEGNPYGSGFNAANRSVNNGPPVLPRPPGLRHEPSSGESISSVSSGGSYSRTPTERERPLPIHPLATGRTTVVGLPGVDSMPTPIVAGVDSMRRPLASSAQGYGFESAPSAFRTMHVERLGDDDVVMTNDVLPPPPSQNSKAGLDGMSALLRAGEIVGQGGDN